jgi:hypothetical protein
MKTELELLAIGAAVGSICLLGVFSLIISEPETTRNIVTRRLILKLRILCNQARILFVKLDKLRIRLLMVLNRARKICLQRGYLTGYEPNLRSNSVLCSACINHPVKIVNVFLESFHIVSRTLSPNDLADRCRPDAAPGQRKGPSDN